MQKRDNICLKCPYIAPLNLEWADPLDKNAGGEHYIQRKHIENAKSKAIIHNLFATVGILWDILIKIANSGKVEPIAIFHAHLWAVTSDLKNSAYLALSGRYREAYIMLRSALDIYIYGNYFGMRVEKIETEEDRTQINNEFISWQNGKTTDFPRFVEVIKNLEKKQNNK